MSEALYKTLFAAGGELYAVLDGEGTFKEVNPAGLALLDLDASEIIGKKASDVFGDSAAAFVGEKAIECIDESTPLRFDWSVRRVGFPRKLFSARMAPVIEKKGKKPELAVLIALDIGEFDALRQDLTSLHEAVDAMRDRVGSLLEAAKADATGKM